MRCRSILPPPGLENLSVEPQTIRAGGDSLVPEIQEDQVGEEEGVHAGEHRQCRSSEVTSWGHQGWQLWECEFRLLGMRLKIWESLDQRESLYLAFRKQDVQEDPCMQITVSEVTRKAWGSGAGTPGLGAAALTAVLTDEGCHLGWGWDSHEASEDGVASKLQSYRGRLDPTAS